jgi:hypothetical protein
LCRRFSSDYYLSVAAAAEDCEQVDSVASSAAEPRVPIQNVLAAIDDVKLLADADRAEPHCASGESSALFRDLAATIVGRVIQGALARAFAHGAEGSAYCVPSTAADDLRVAAGQSCSWKALQQERAAPLPIQDHSSPELEHFLQSVPGDFPECDRSQLVAIESGPSSSYPQAVSYPLTPRRLVALKDRNECAMHVGDAKQGHAQL